MYTFVCIRKKVHKVSCSFSDHLLLHTEILWDNTVRRNGFLPVFYPHHLSTVWGFRTGFDHIQLSAALSNKPSKNVAFVFLYQKSWIYFLHGFYDFTNLV